MANRASFPILLGIVVAMAAGSCSKQSASPSGSGSAGGGNPSLSASSCGAGAAHDALMKVTAEEGRIGALDSAAKKSPSNENIRSVYDAEKALQAEINGTLKSWSACADIPMDARTNLQRSSDRLGIALRYWTDNFPDLSR